jgi:hypothetical protein
LDCVALNDMMVNNEFERVGKEVAKV